MKNKIKTISFIFLFFGLILVIGGGTYAFFNYTEYSNSIITNHGQVYMKMNKDSNNITLNTVFPETYEEALYVNGESGTLREDNIIEFTIIGKNNNSNPVYYELDLQYGEDVLNKTRIDDKYLRFELSDITDSNNIIIINSNSSYESINDKKIYIDTISNTDTNYSKTYRLRMWYAEDILISDTDPEADFRASDLNNDKGNGDLPIYTDLYASVKVKVYGDFEHKKMYTDSPEACFSTANFVEHFYEVDNPVATSAKIRKIIPKFMDDFSSDDDRLVILGFDSSCGSDMIIPEYINNKQVAGIDFSDGYDTEETINIPKFDERTGDLIRVGVQNINVDYTEYFNTIYIPKSVERIGDFSNVRVEHIIVDPSNPVYDSRNGCDAIIETDTNTLVVGSSNTIVPNTVTAIGDYSFNGKNIKKLIIPSSVIRIGAHAFKDCYRLKNVYIPNSVEYIGYSAFNECINLESINIPNGINKIDTTVFGGCSKLKNVTIPNSVNIIENSAFSESGLTSINIPSSVTYFGSWTFRRCYDLTDVYVNWTSFNDTNVVVYDDTFLDVIEADINLHVPAGTGNLYRNHSVWGEFNIIEDN